MEKVFFNTNLFLLYNKHFISFSFFQPTNPGVFYGAKGTVEEVMGQFFQMMSNQGSSCSSCSGCGDDSEDGCCGC